MRFSNWWENRRFVSAGPMRETCLLDLVWETLNKNDSRQARVPHYIYIYYIYIYIFRYICLCSIKERERERERERDTQPCTQPRLCRICHCVKLVAIQRTIESVPFFLLCHAICIARRGGLSRDSSVGSIEKFETTGLSVIWRTLPCSNVASWGYSQTCACNGFTA